MFPEVRKNIILENFEEYCTIWEIKFYICIRFHSSNFSVWLFRPYSVSRVHETAEMPGNLGIWGPRQPVSGKDYKTRENVPDLLCCPEGGTLLPKIHRVFFCLFRIRSHFYYIMIRGSGHEKNGIRFRNRVTRKYWIRIRIIPRYTSFFIWKKMQFLI